MNMKLITKKQEQQLQYQYRKDASKATAVVYLKLFALASGWTFYVTQQDPDNPDMLFGLVTGPGLTPEWGYVSLTELKSMKWNGIPRIERDRSWKPIRVMEIIQHDPQLEHMA